MTPYRAVMMTRKQFFRSMLGVVGGVVGLAALGGCTTTEGLNGGGGAGGGGKADHDERPDSGSEPLTDAGVTDDASDGSLPTNDGSLASSDAGTGPTPDAATATCTPSIEIDSNHGHAMTVSAADVAAGIAKSYNIKGASGHAHAVTVTAAMFATLRSAGTVIAASTEVSFHTHDVTINCA